ncbi:sialidase family protein [Paenibacillus sp. YN15]|uniref:sialidase family protein n=1 Tax=Paenibacillus sp. YN15 TaxID=1742774 RepID=UPI000DCDBCA8|nr:sialidase family protein [Paenibacillus sp. YN15]RAV05469.1 exo-alpha-sialidase [Paenibacillus sp. YN15]
MISKLETFIVSRDDTIYEAWPDVVLTDSGKLVAVFSECTHHHDRSYTRIMLADSGDRGRTWMPKRPLTAGTDGYPYWNCARISKLGDGRLVIAVDRRLASREGEVVLWLGDSEGEVWEGPVETPVSGIVPDKLCELPSGRWLLSAHWYSPGHGYLEQRLWYSDNSGATWKGPVTVASEPGLNLCEISLLPLPDGVIAAIMRENSGVGKDAYKCLSRDQGLTWEGPYPMTLPGCHRPSAGLLHSGQVLVTYRFLQGGDGTFGTAAQNFFGAFLTQDSLKAKERKQQSARIFPIDYDRHPEADLGYSGWIQFDDGEIYIVSYIVDDAPKAQIRGYSMREDNWQ